MSITLAAVSNIQHDLTAFAIKKTLAAVPIDRILIFSDRRLPIKQDHDWIPLPENFNRFDYGHFICKKLAQHVQTDHVMVVQYDGMAARSDYWDPRYLDYDYIGAVFNHRIPALASCYRHLDPRSYQNSSWYRDHSYRVGNGGFSLRSRRLLEVLQDQIFEFPWNGVDIEDFLTCFVWREHLEKHYGIRFAPCDLGLMFSRELVGWQDHSLGFHGWHHIIDFLSDDECLYYIKTLIGNELRSDDQRLWYLLQNSQHLPGTQDFLQKILISDRGLEFTY